MHRDPQIPGKLGGFGPLVLPRVPFVAGRKGRHVAIALSSRHGRDRRRVDAARQRHADGHVGARDDLSDAVDFLPDPLDRLVVERRRVLEAPVDTLLDPALSRVDVQQRRGGQPAHATHGRERLRKIVPVVQRLDAVVVHLERHDAAGNQRAQLTGEHQRIRTLDDVQRLLAHPIARDHHPPASLVHEREREHAAQLVDARDALVFVQMDDRLAVAVRAEAMAAGLEVAAELGVVVDLAVGDERDRPVLVVQGLRAARHIDDGQPARRDGGVRADVKAVAVGPAMPQLRGERRQQRFVGRREAVEPHDTGDTTHGNEDSGMRSRGRRRLLDARREALGVDINIVRFARDLLATRRHAAQSLRVGEAAADRVRESAHAAARERPSRPAVFERVEFRHVPHRVVAGDDRQAVTERVQQRQPDTSGMDEQPAREEPRSRSSPRSPYRPSGCVGETEGRRLPLEALTLDAVADDAPDQIGILADSAGIASSQYRNGFCLEARDDRITSGRRGPAAYATRPAAPASTRARPRRCAADRARCSCRRCGAS